MLLTYSYGLLFLLPPPPHVTVAPFDKCPAQLTTYATTQHFFPSESFFLLLRWARLFFTSVSFFHSFSKKICCPRDSNAKWKKKENKSCFSICWIRCFDIITCEVEVRSEGWVHFFFSFFEKYAACRSQAEIAEEKEAFFPSRVSLWIQLLNLLKKPKRCRVICKHLVVEAAYTPKMRTNIEESYCMSFLFHTGCVENVILAFFNTDTLNLWYTAGLHNLNWHNTSWQCLIRCDKSIKTKPQFLRNTSSNVHLCRMRQ